MRSQHLKDPSDAKSEKAAENLRWHGHGSPVWFLFAKGGWDMMGWERSGIFSSLQSISKKYQRSYVNRTLLRQAILNHAEEIKSRVAAASPFAIFQQFYTSIYSVIPNLSIM